MTATPSPEDLGLQPVAEDTLSSIHARRVAHTLDVDDEILAQGTLPLCWLWTYFAPMVPTSALRADGHPAAGAGTPLEGLDRRMFVGGDLERLGPIRLDRVTERTSAVLDAQEKEGRTGSFLLIEVEHQYRQDGDVVVVEHQQLMYRSAVTQTVPAPGPPMEPPRSAGAESLMRPDERLLFRYSALTFNSHRIHYDLPYATQVEGYPTLVVHGPLTATFLAHLAEEQLGMPLTTFRFRAPAPTFAGTPVTLVCDELDADRTLPLRAVRADGAVVMTARAR